MTMVWMGSSLLRFVYSRHPHRTKKGASEPVNSCGRRKRVARCRGLGENLTRTSDFTLRTLKIRSRSSVIAAEVRGPRPDAGLLIIRIAGRRRRSIASPVPLLHPVALLFAHLVETLLLTFVQHGLDLSVGTLPQGLHLAEPVFAGK